LNLATVGDAAGPMGGLLLSKGVDMNTDGPNGANGANGGNTTKPVCKHFQKVLIPDHTMP
jgi:hypothetical protein